MRDRLKRAFPKTPSSFETRMEQVLADLPKRRSRRNLRRTAAAMLAAAVAMGGLAVAATHSQLLDALFPTQPPTPQAENLVVELGMAAEAANATLTIEEYLLDGADLYVRWNVTSTADEPLMLMVSDVQTPYAAQSILDQNFCSWDLGMGVLLTPDYPSHSEISRIHFDEEIGEETFEATLSAALLKPIAPMQNEDDLSDFSDTPTLLYSRYEDGLTLLNAVCNLNIEGDSLYTTDSEDLYKAMRNEYTFRRDDARHGNLRLRRGTNTNSGAIRRLARRGKHRTHADYRAECICVRSIHDDRGSRGFHSGRRGHSISIDSLRRGKSGTEHRFAALV